MDTEKRKHPRFQPLGLLAKLTIGQTISGKEVVLEGTVIDMSYNGIKVKFMKPLQVNVDQHNVRIELTMPQSGIPLSIHGIIRHIRKYLCGLQFAENYDEQAVDELMFESIKLSDLPVQDKQINDKPEH